MIQLLITRFAKDEDKLALCYLDPLDPARRCNPVTWRLIWSASDLPFYCPWGAGECNKQPSSKLGQNQSIRVHLEGTNGRGYVDQGGYIRDGVGGVSQTENILLEAGREVSEIKQC